MADFDLLIVGGGMVGSCAAALAASATPLAHLRIAVLEAQPMTMPPSEGEIDLRVSAISPASQRVLDSLGAWSRLAAQHRCAYGDMVVWDAKGRAMGAGSLQFSAAQSSEPHLGYIIENRRLQWSICEAAAFRSRVAVLRGELAALELREDIAVASLTDGRSITAALVVGADGAASQSRQLAGIETSGWDYEQRAFVTHVGTALPHRHTAWQRFLRDGPIAFLPLADGRSSIVWTTTPAHAASLMEASAAQLSAEIGHAIDGVMGEIVTGGPRAQFPLRLTHARDYCRHRFVLVGDAAHAVHPLAGQGVNLGFMDCAALIQTLADECAAGASVDALAELRVLRRYERWRKSENVLALGLIDSLNRLFGAASDPAGWIRRNGLSLVNASTSLKRFLMARAMGTHGEVPRVALPIR